MNTTATILIVLILLAVLLSWTPVLASIALERFLRRRVPGCTVDIRAGALWLLTGNIDSLSVHLEHCDLEALRTGISPAADEGIDPSHRDAEPLILPPLTLIPTPLEPATGSDFVDADAAEEPRRRSDTPSYAAQSAARRSLARVGEVHLSLKGVTVRGYHIQSLEVLLRDFRYDFRAILKKELWWGASGPGRLRAVLPESAINQAATSKMDRPEVKDLVIRLDAGSPRVELEFKSPLGWIPLAASCQLQIEHGRRITFHDLNVSAVGASLPGFLKPAAESFAQRFNPILDLDRYALPAEVELEALTIFPGAAMAQVGFRLLERGSLTTPTGSQSEPDGE